jgi:ParB family transcriptional regulator, chromosome partitioning protein
MSEKTKKLTPFEALKKRAISNIEEQVSTFNQLNTEEIKTHKTIEEPIKAPEYPPTNSTLIIEIDLIDPNPYQPRREFDSKKINDLADSISATGQIEPIIVRRVSGRYQLIAGERRLRAVKSLNHSVIDAIVKNADDGMVAIMALAENLEREDLSDYEIGLAIHNVQHLFVTKKELGDYIGKTRMDVYRYTAFLDLPDWILSRLNNNPSIFNRTNALALKTFIADTADPESTYKEPILKAMDMLEANALTQSLFIQKIKRLIRESTNPRHHEESIVEKKYTTNGKGIGKLIFDEKGLSINIKAEALTEIDVNQIHEFILQRISTDQNKIQ